MFPAYGGGGRGGNGPPPFYGGQPQPWAMLPQNMMQMRGLLGAPPPFMGFMSGPPPGGGPPPQNQMYGGNRGGYHGGGAGRSRGNNNRGYEQEVVEVLSSDDDNQPEDRRRGGKKKRKRNRSRSPSHHKRHRSRSRSPQSSRRHHHNRQDNDERHRDRYNRDNERSHYHNQRGPHHHRGRGGNDQDGYQNQQNYRHQQSHSSQGRFHEPPPPGTTPWVTDCNPFDRFEDQRGFGRGRHGDRDFVPRDPGPPHGFHNYPPHLGGGYGRHANSYEMQEHRRIQVSQTFPQKVFLEEVQLDSEFAFRIDTSSNPSQANYRSVAMNQKSTYEGGVGKGILGASEEEISKVYSKFHAFRCKLPDNMKDFSESANSEEDEDDSKPKMKADTPIATNFISLKKDVKKSRKERESNSDRYNINKGMESYSFEHKEGEMTIKEKVEYYNKEVRNQPKNVSLWKEFVQFQDKVFEESSLLFEQEDSSSGRRGKKNRVNRKALLEKKIAILEKAIESNPKCLKLHEMRLEFLLELEKPRHVLSEWKKLVAQYQQIAPFWTEYLLFSSCQHLLFSYSTIIQVFETCFQKFQLMLNPQYPDFQRPKKFPLFISDITFSLGLLLKNAGFVERAVALHQAQLEFDFYCPTNLFKDKTLLTWKDEIKLFEEFWNAGTPHFGEISGKGWRNLIEKENSEEDKPCFTISDSKISDFEDETFDTLNEEMKALQEKQATGEDPDSLLTLKFKRKPNIWVNIESCRSKLYWLPWRKEVSDVDDCEDLQRVVPASDIANFICPVPNEVKYITDFSRQATHFRHIVNFLLTLREDFMTHTQAVDMICSPFRSITMTESSSLFSEIYYWRNLSDLYVGKSKADSKAHNVFAPEGFRLADMVSANKTSGSTLTPAIYKVEFKGQEEEEESTLGELTGKKLSLLKENEEKHVNMVHRVVEAGLELLETEFACTLFQMFLRFQQKLTCVKDENVKQRIKFAKELMKHEKIRNSIGGYREMAMMEYFTSESTEKAIGLLIKSINVTTKSLNLNDWDQLDWDKDWNLFVDLVSLYRQLVELYLNERSPASDAKAYYTLVQLGNGFQPVEPETLEIDENELWKPKTNALVKAVRSFEKIMQMLIPTFSLKKETDETEKEEESARNLDDTSFCSKWDGERCIEFLLQKRNFIAEWTCCYSLFQFFRQDFDEACQVYENALSRISREPLQARDMYDSEIIRMHIREQLYISWCSLAARCLVKDPLMNAKFRNVLAQALEEFPSSPPLLILFTDVENQTSIAGKLWRLMMSNLKEDSDKVINQWAPLIIGIGLARKIEELEHDEEIGLPCFGLGGPAVPQDTIFYKLDSMISVAEQHPGARHCPLLWRVHLKLLALRAKEGKDVKRARTTFYDAIRHCPSSKALYLDGINYFPDLLYEVTDLLTEKQLLVRLPIEELDVLLEMEEDVDQSKKVSKDDDNDDDDITEVDPKERSSKIKNSREPTSDGEIGDSD